MFEQIAPSVVPTGFGLSSDDRPLSTGADESSSGEAVDLSAALSLVRQGALGIDLAWNEARINQSDISLVIALGEASHSLHRALAVLADPA
jgi:hypothetical protein